MSTTETITDPWDLIRRAVNDGRNADPSLTDDQATAVEQFAATLIELAARALPSAGAPAMARMHATPTSQAMRQSALPRSGSLRATMVQLLLNYGHTDDQMEVTLGRSHQSVSAARYTLVEQGWVRALTSHGETVLRPTRAGNPAIVWTLTPEARLRLAIEQDRAR